MHWYKDNAEYVVSCYFHLHYSVFWLYYILVRHQKDRTKLGRLVEATATIAVIDINAKRIRVFDWFTLFPQSLLKQAQFCCNLVSNPKSKIVKVLELLFPLYRVGPKVSIFHYKIKFCLLKLSFFIRLKPKASFSIKICTWHTGYYFFFSLSFGGPFSFLTEDTLFCVFLSFQKIRMLKKMH